jgi:hypothetical protein
MLAAITAPVLELAVFVEATFATGPVYLWSGMGTITWNGQSWLGLGAIGGISPIEEGSTVEAKGITLTLSGFDSTLLPDVMSEFALLQPVSVWLACFNSGVLILNPILCFEGRMDQPMIEVTGKTATISINCESVMVDLNVSVDRRLSQEDQQRDWPGDLGLAYTEKIIERSINWGKSTPTTGPVI